VFHTMPSSSERTRRAVDSVFRPPGPLKWFPRGTTPGHLAVGRSDVVSVSHVYTDQPKCGLRAREQGRRHWVVVVGCRGPTASHGLATAWPRPDLGRADQAKALRVSRIRRHGEGHRVEPGTSSV